MRNCWIVFSFVYVILNGLVYTTYYDHDKAIYKRDSNCAFAEKKGNDFECFYYDSPHNVHALIAKYSDLIQKQYNYDKALKDSFSTSDVSNCVGDPSLCIMGTIPGSGINCKYLYVESSHDDIFDTITNKDISDRFLTTLLLSLFVCLANIGLAILGFLLFRTPGEF